MAPRLKRDLLIYGLILLVCLVCAYFVSLPKDTVNLEYVEWTRLPKVKVASLVLSGPKVGKISLNKKVGDERFVGSQTKDLSAANPVFFVSNEKSSDVLAALDPFYVHRDIGPSKENQLDKFGIGADSSVFSVTDQSGVEVLNLKIGKTVYGGREIYVLDQKSDRLLLVSDVVFNLMAEADRRLIETKLVNLDGSEVESVELKLGEREVLFRKDLSTGDVRWLEGTEGEKPAPESFARVLERILRMRVEGYLNEEESTLYSGKDPLMTLSFKTSDNHEAILHTVSDGILGKDIIVLSRPFLPLAAKVELAKWTQLESELQSFLPK